jgi:hypothetical protein
LAKLKLALINLLVLGLLYGTLELSYSAYRYFLTDTSPDSYWLFEHPSETIRFDPDRGYFLTRTPSRVARIVRKQVEYVGSFRGNGQGFPDRDDFTIHRSTPSQQRIAVLGDSFTATTLVPINSPAWPGRVEDITGASGGRPLVLLNFAVDGAGLANWASILRNIIVKDQYELDGLVFAVAWNDLDRKFTVLDQIDSETITFARAPSWDVGAQPKTLSEARALLKKQAVFNSYILSPAEFDAAVSRSWKPRQWRFHVSARLMGIAESLMQRFEQAPKPVSGFEEGQLELMHEIRRLADGHSLPIAVAYIPSRDELLDQPSASTVERARQFSDILGAHFMDGREAFRGLTSQQIKDDWFPHDGHWNQGGSDRFAEFIVTQLPNWVEARVRTTNRVPRGAGIAPDRAPAELWLENASSPALQFARELQLVKFN